ncbi:MAG TPA: CPBP family intramembrane glutamic endopeptidase [Rectinemataceae bacterium]|nr:CPBP family intramembrane glutamic endopeptidase [Rectinemataceae bacterium]
MQAGQGDLGDGPATGSGGDPMERGGPQGPAPRHPLLDIRPAGAPSHPMLEAALLFAAFYLAAFLPADPSAMGRSLGRIGFHLLLLADTLPKALLVLYMMSRAEGPAAFGLGRMRRRDLGRGLMVALGALALVALPSLAMGSLGLTNPLLGAALRPSTPAVAVVLVVLVSSLSVGYSEELFFRVFLIRRLRQAGFPAPWALLASSLLFGSAHGLQGPLGLALGTLLGLWFAWRWHRSGNIHEIALGHAIYDALVILFTLYR